MYQYGESYIRRNHIPLQETDIIRLLSMCRTALPGSHYINCDHCNYQGKAYNSCRNRHCPKCQHQDQLQWMNARMNELLPVGYYHLVFTIPCELNPLCLSNKKVMYDILFKAASQTVLELCRDPKHLGAEIGLITVLHTWGQNMMEHPHLHYIIPAGGLSLDKQYRVPVLSLVDNLYEKGWNINIQTPFGNPVKVLVYLSRYVFRIARSDKRILDVNNGKVFFNWKDFRTGLFRKMSLDIDKFIRRFLLHVLPQGFFKVRYYGLFSSRHRKENIQLVKELIARNKLFKKEEAFEDGLTVWEKQDTIWDEIIQAILNYRKPNCPVCKKGMLHFAGLVPSHLNGSG